MSSLYQVQTGFPLTISGFGDTANAGTVLGENPIRPNLTGQPLWIWHAHCGGMVRFESLFDSAGFHLRRRRPQHVIGPGLATLDFALAREFWLLEGMTFQFRAEFFNALNQVNLGTPDRFVNTP